MLDGLVVEDWRTHKSSATCRGLPMTDRRAEPIERCISERCENNGAPLHLGGVVRESDEPPELEPPPQLVAQIVAVAGVVPHDPKPQVRVARGEPAEHLGDTIPVVQVGIAAHYGDERLVGIGRLEPLPRRQVNRVGHGHRPAPGPILDLVGQPLRGGRDQVRLIQRAHRRLNKMRLATDPVVPVQMEGVIVIDDHGNGIRLALADESLEAELTPGFEELAPEDDHVRRVGQVLTPDAHPAVVPRLPGESKRFPQPPPVAAVLKWLDHRRDGQRD